MGRVAGQKDAARGERIRDERAQLPATGGDELDRDVRATDRLRDEREQGGDVALVIVREHEHPTPVQVVGEKGLKVGLIDAELDHARPEVLLEGSAEEDAADGPDWTAARAADLQRLANRAAVPVGRDQVVRLDLVFVPVTATEARGHPFFILLEGEQLRVDTNVGAELERSLPQHRLERVLGNRCTPVRRERHLRRRLLARIPGRLLEPLAGQALDARAAQSKVGRRLRNAEPDGAVQLQRARRESERAGMRGAARMSLDEDGGHPAGGQEHRRRQPDQAATHHQDRRRFHLLVSITFLTVHLLTPFVWPRAPRSCRARAGSSRFLRRARPVTRRGAGGRR